MNNLVLPGRTLPATAPSPGQRMSAGLRSAVMDWSRAPHPDLGRYGPTLTRQQRIEAEGMLGEVQHALRPAPRELIALWVTRVAGGVANPPGPEDLAVRISAICEACCDLPWSAFTAGSSAVALRAWQWMPSAAQVHALCSEHVGSLYALRTGLTLALETKERSAAPTDIDRDKVREAVSSLVAETAAREVRVRQHVQPAYLSDGALLASYEVLAAQGNQAAATRLRQIRALLAEGASEQPGVP